MSSRGEELPRGLLQLLSTLISSQQEEGGEEGWLGREKQLGITIDCFKSVLAKVDVPFEGSVNAVFGSNVWQNSRNSGVPIQEEGTSYVIRISNKAPGSVSTVELPEERLVFSNSFEFESLLTRFKETIGFILLLFLLLNVSTFLSERS